MSSFRSTSSVPARKRTVATRNKASLILLPLVPVILPAQDAKAQIIPAIDSTQSAVETTGNQTDITGGQTSADGTNLFHDFDQFDVEAGHTANFVTVPNVENIVSQISGGEASTIDGTLQVSGSSADLYLMNPAGVLIGPDAHLNLGGSISATTATGIEFGDAQIGIGEPNDYVEIGGDPSAFRFDSEQAGAVVNLGDLSVNEGESIELMGGTVVNTGELSAPEGAITLAAVEGGNRIRIQQGSGILSLEVEAADERLNETGAIAPSSIGEMLTGGSLSHGTTLTTNADGSVRIGNEPAIRESIGETVTTGSLSVAGVRGGNVNVLGNTVSLVEAALDASGEDGGGLIRVGGDYKGDGSVFNAARTLVDADSLLLADALQTGNGGQIIIWADERTTYDGHLSARGGSRGGDGGFAEISGKKSLTLTGSVDLSASEGDVGTALFDPQNITITDATPIPPDTGSNLFLSSNEVEQLSVSANVILEATNNITIEAIGDGTLTIEPGRSITLTADANRRDGGEFRMENADDVIEVTEGNITISGAGVTAGRLSLNSDYDSDDPNNPLIGNVDISSSEHLVIREIISERGQVALEGESVAVGTINTSTDDYNKYGDRGADGRSLVIAGDVEITSSKDISITEIFTQSWLDSEDEYAPDGGNVTVSSATGNIDIGTVQTFSKITEGGEGGEGDVAGRAGSVTISTQNGVATIGSIESYSTAEGNTALGGGDVSISALSINSGGIDTSTRARNGAQTSGDITLSAQGSVNIGGELESYSYARSGTDAGDAGNILIEGNQVITKLIEAWSESRNGDSGNGGNVEIRQYSEAAGNAVEVQGKIETFSHAIGGVAGRGGNVLIDVGESVETDVGTFVFLRDEVVTGSETTSPTGTSSTGGSVDIQASVIDAEDSILTGVAYNFAVGDSGNVALNGDRSITVKDIIADDASGEAGEIRLNGDRISITGSTVEGEFVRFNPANSSFNINIAEETAANALTLKPSELSKVRGLIEVGQQTYSGTVTLGESVITTAGSRPRIDILGGDRLIGPDLPTSLTYSLDTATGSGSNIVGADLRFFEIENIEGGSGDDLFDLRAGTALNDFESFAGNGGENTIAFQSATGEGVLIDLEETNVSDFKIVGPTGTSSANSLRGSDIANNWSIIGQGQGRLNGTIAFENFEAIVGGSDRDTLDYSHYAEAISVALEGKSTGLESFAGIESIIGSSSARDELRGSSRDDTFSIGNTNSLNDVEFSSFEILQGSGGDNTFLLEQVGADISIAGGSDLDNSQSNNRLIYSGSSADWQIEGKNRGTVEQFSNTISFSEIQHIENVETNAGISNDAETSTGEMNVLFAVPSAQITGSISSGSSNLTLTGDDINLGHGNGAGGHHSGSVSGNGTLTIRPLTSSTNIEIGGVDEGAGGTLNITDGEVDAIQDGFIEITFGDTDMTGDINTRRGLSFQDALSLVSMGDINTTAGTLSADAGITIETDASFSGSSLSTSGGNVVVQAQDSILLEDVTTTGNSQSGDIEIRSQSGEITAGRLSSSTYNWGDGTTSAAIAGGVSLSSAGDIEVDIIQAEGPRDDAGGDRIEITTAGSFRATGDRYGRSISTEGARSGEGSIQITFGSESAAEEFTVGSSAGTSSTAGAIVSGQTQLSTGDFDSSYTQADIALINRGAEAIPPSAPARAQTPTQKRTSPLIPASFDIQSTATLSLSPSADERDIFNTVEVRTGQEFSQYFALDGTEIKRPTATLRQAQDKLAEVERTNGVSPALVYVYFVPDAATEPTSQLSNQTISDNDELEVMLVTANRAPTRHRQWGVTRAQVQETTQTLRKQTTSQFSTERQYLPPAQQLYDWVVAPITEQLAQQNVQSLGFVMETGLRAMPLAALHDGDRYLVENYSLGILPSFSLTDFESEDSQTQDFRDSEVLAMGASEFEDQPDLPAVDEEVSLITQQLWQGDAFLNENFVRKNLQSQMAENDYGIVHLATHANFKADDPDSSYIQMWDERLNLNELSDLGLSQAEIGLIILSACNTAMGDRNSEYGFAGFAVNSGVPSALASLWPVNDEGTLGFMSQFYTELRASSVRAGALRQAQLKMISGEVGIDYGEVYGPSGETIVSIPELEESGQWDFSHPFYWSAFTMIGNPW